MTTLAPSLPPAPPAEDTAQDGRRPRLAPHGLAWLVWRRHRASFRLWMFSGLTLTAYLVYWHVRYHATFVGDTLGGANTTSGLPPDVGLSAATFLLLAAPFLTAVVFGAQLFERPFTDGTFTLIRTQSVTAAAWVCAELAVSAAMVVLCVTPCAAALTWDFHIDFMLEGHWHGIWAFNTVGPAAVGVCLVGLFLGAVSGLVWRRSAPAKGLALVLIVAFEAGLSWALGAAGLEGRTRPAGYLPFSGIASLQLAATGICLLLCAVLAGACLRLVRSGRGGAR